MRMLDLFCGRWGWSEAFAARGWECVGVDLTEPPEVPKGCIFIQKDILEISSAASHHWGGQGFDFICASSPCEQFSVHGMKHFHPNPPYPELGIKLFEHTRRICEESGVPYVMENVRAAQKFIGNAVHKCGPFYLWGTGVPTIVPGGIGKGLSMAIPKNLKTREEITAWRRINDPNWSSGGSEKRKQITAKAATIPPELANCVADYAERICVDLNAGASASSIAGRQSQVTRTAGARTE